jgi:lipoprotein-anchoring transpeptidase ErfK/SrfK
MGEASRRVARAAILASLFVLAPAAAAVEPRQSQAESPDGAWSLFREPNYAGGVPMLADTAGGTARTAVRLKEQADEDARVSLAVQMDSSRLRPGQFVWRPERGRDGPVEIVVSLAAQRIYVFQSRNLIGVSTVSTGRPGHVTPTGSFPILERKREHYSNLYNNAPMPNMQRLTWDGIALHAGVIPGRPASHGCVRLPMEFSDLLFGVTRRGTMVHIVSGRPDAAVTALNYALGSGGNPASRRVR